MSMSSILSTAVSALAVNSERVATSAHNIVNVNTDGYLASEAQGQRSPPVYAAHALGAGAFQVEAIEPSNVNLAREFVNITIARAAYEANATVIRTLEDMHRDGLDIKA